MALHASKTSGDARKIGHLTALALRFGAFRLASDCQHSRYSGPLEPEPRGHGDPVRRDAKQGLVLGLDATEPHKADLAAV